jgi:hypothetical protein
LNFIFRVLRNFYSELNITLREVGDDDPTVQVGPDDIERKELTPAKYNIFLGDKLIKEDLNMELGAVYTIIAREQGGAHVHINQIRIIKWINIYIISF